MSKRKREDGAAAVEFALVLPIFIFLVVRDHPVRLLLLDRRDGQQRRSRGSASRRGRGLLGQHEDDQLRPLPGASDDVGRPRVSTRRPWRSAAPSRSRSPPTATSSTSSRCPAPSRVSTSPAWRSTSSRPPPTTPARGTEMGTPKRDERGVYALLTAILAILLMSIAAMAVDIGNAVARKSDVQGQADFGALAGAAQARHPGAGTVPTAVLDAVRDSMNDNRPAQPQRSCASSGPGVRHQRPARRRRPHQWRGPLRERRSPGLLAEGPGRLRLRRHHGIQLQRRAGQRHRRALLPRQGAAVLRLRRLLLPPADDHRPGARSGHDSAVPPSDAASGTRTSAIDSVTPPNTAVGVNPGSDHHRDRRAEQHRRCHRGGVHLRGHRRHAGRSTIVIQAPTEHRGRQDPAGHPAQLGLLHRCPVLRPDQEDGADGCLESAKQFAGRRSPRSTARAPRPATSAPSTCRAATPRTVPGSPTTPRSASSTTSAS